MNNREERKRFFDELAAKYPPGSILPKDAPKAEKYQAPPILEDRHRGPGRSKSAATTRPKPDQPFVDSHRRLSVFRALPSTFGLPTLEENVADRPVSTPTVERNTSQPQPQIRSDRGSQPKYEPDFNIMSESVISLDETNFDDFTESKEKALILFYKNFQCPLIELEANFTEVAESSRNVKHGFGAVDCVNNRNLCAREKICATPELKLYSNGFEVGNIMKAREATSAQMSLTLAMTPVLKQPKINTIGSYQTCPVAKRASTMW